MKYQKTTVINEGKTKIVWAVEGQPSLVIIENKPDITAFDDPAYTRQFELKSRYATTTTCRVFELLRKQAIPVAYLEQLSPTEFLAPACQMIPLEVVGRRYAVGSYLKRQPKLKRGDGEPPYRFEKIYTEFFLKTTRGKLIGSNGEVLVDGLDAKKGEEDPLIANPHEHEWKLLHPKKPTAEADLGKAVRQSAVLPNSKFVPLMEDILVRAFSVLEQAWWETHQFRLIDMKLEFGVTDKNELLIADVIDNDSWRLRNNNWQELSKEAFRQGEEMSEVERKYGLVAELVEKLN
ncbi:MAG TPA: hypothetical protein ENN22_13680 [bacterium]|nr:hypothetical protein [bacterium]